MASRFDTTKSCLALSYEGHPYRFDNVCRLILKNEGEVVQETVMDVFIVQIIIKIVIIKCKLLTVSIALQIQMLGILKWLYLILK